MSSKTVLILGSSVHPLLISLTTSLAQQHTVYLTLPSTAAVPAALSESSKITVLSLDMSSSLSAATVARRIASSVSGIDILVNDAGLGGSQALLDAMRTSSTYKTKIASMTDTVVVFADLLERNGGRVVCLGTSAAMISAPCMNNARFSTKEALVHLCSEMRTALAPWGVPVSWITVDWTPTSGPLVVASSTRRGGTMQMSGLVDEIEHDGRRSGWDWPGRFFRGKESDESMVEKGVLGC
ncbi:D-beta-hydroxybutyrate dehydrogenase-like protein [Emericellopsis cladophorae]|uniref:D-beta-hydroxybutyrate dehydrogenase-like protein n=1 Tax=Emericellopsis cladophorae TaxID=2686198 RepID=A0A9Q0BA60_9HYPO|nr:D-beta-hydroxybutyrate dehydrogenase-like protein [Emericellopsis cladophorae]KAI6778682.1 D-beta-hydroxybutyrate dehydrogenase-like protein [Emericellopsis cladophorae]